MNKYFVVSSFLIMTLLQCSGQNYIKYFENINKAEQYINRLALDSALIVYESTFKDFPNHFYKDLHNACLCNIKDKKLEKAENLAEQLILHGYELNDFSKDSAFSDFVKSTYWGKFQNNYPSLHGKYLQALNPSYRKTLYRMSVLDQKAASSRQMDFQDSTFYHQALELDSLFKQHGFPIYMRNKDTLNAKIFIMLRHYFGLVNRTKSNPEMLKQSCYRSMDFSKINLRDIVEKSFKTGLILPQTYIGMVSYWDQNNSFGDIVVKIDFELEKVTLLLNISPDRVVEVNKNRVLIGLPEISYTNPDVLNNTWYSKYPFKEIKNALLACDSCTSYLDYMDISVNEELKVSNTFKVEPKLEGFIITNHSNINNKFYDGIRKYYKNIKGNK